MKRQGNLCSYFFRIVCWRAFCQNPYDLSTSPNFSEHWKSFGYFLTACSFILMTSRKVVIFLGQYSLRSFYVLKSSSRFIYFDVLLHENSNCNKCLSDASGSGTVQFLGVEDIQDDFVTVNEPKLFEDFQEHSLKN